MFNEVHKSLRRRLLDYTCTSVTNSARCIRIEEVTLHGYETQNVKRPKHTLYSVQHEDCDMTPQATDLKTQLCFWENQRSIYASGGEIITSIASTLAT